MTKPSNAAGAGAKAKQSALRVALIVSLLAAAGTCAGVAYTQLRDSETQVAIEAFNSLAEGAAHGAQQIASQRALGASAMSTLMSQQFPNASDWPFIVASGYIEMSKSIADLSGSLTQSIIVRFAPDQIDDINDHAKGHYETEGRPNLRASAILGSAFGSQTMRTIQLCTMTSACQ